MLRMSFALVGLALTSSTPLAFVASSRPAIKDL
jgi:hypothetical protein